MKLFSRLIKKASKTWRDVLGDKDNKMVDWFEHGDWSQVPNKAKRTHALEIINLLDTLSQLMPYDGIDKYGIISWLKDAVKAGAITPQEENNIIRFCIDDLNF